MRRFEYLLVFLLLSAVPLNAQVHAVWVATAHRIDFPKTDGAINQQKELRELINKAAEKGINTLIFQVRGRGDAMYQSALEPWSESLTGKLGSDPGWDPLQLAIEECRSKGIRLIAWFNVFKVADATSQIQSTGKRKHPAAVNPGWVIRSGGEQFLNPGLPAVRDYLASVAADLVRNYPVDGLQLDFIRYPTGSYDDKAAIRKYKAVKESDDEFRRQAVTGTVRQIRDAVKAVRPGVEFSAAPLGIWKSIPGASGLESYHEVFQDSKGWVDAGLMDAIYPQIYWPGGGISDGINPKPAPDFHILIDHWVKLCAPVPVVAGIGIYKPVVLSQAAELQESSLKSGSAGVAWYSWSQFAGAAIRMEEPTVQIHLLTNQLMMVVFSTYPTQAMNLEFFDSTMTLVRNEKVGSDRVQLFKPEKSIQSIRITDTTGKVLSEVSRN